MKTDLAELNEIWYTNSSGNKYFEPIIPYINDYLLSNNKLNGKLLDIGCGYGEKANIFNTIGYSVTGIDYDSDRIDKAKLDYPKVDFMHFNFVSELPFKDNSFDVIFANSVLQYIEHKPILNECKRILKPNGCIIFIENLRNNPITRIGRTYLKLKKYNYQSYPYNHFTYSEILALRKNFQNSSVHFFHVLTPLSHLKIAKNFFNLFEAIDKLILKIHPLKRYSWLAFFAGINIKESRI